MRRPLDRVPISLRRRYDAGTQLYDSSEKARIPSWTDRVLWHGASVEALVYVAAQRVLVSDHKPVAALLQWTPMATQLEPPRDHAEGKRRAPSAPGAAPCQPPLPRAVQPSKCLIGGLDGAPPVAVVPPAAPHAGTSDCLSLGNLNFGAVLSPAVTCASGLPVAGSCNAMLPALLPPANGTGVASVGVPSVGQCCALDETVDVPCWLPATVPSTEVAIYFPALHDGLFGETMPRGARLLPPNAATTPAAVQLPFGGPALSSAVVETGPLGSQAGGAAMSFAPCSQHATPHGVAKALDPLEWRVPAARVTPARPAAPATVSTSSTARASDPFAELLS